MRVNGTGVLDGGATEVCAVAFSSRGGVERDQCEFVGFTGAAFAVLAVYLAWQLGRCGWGLALDGTVGVAELALVPMLLLVAFALAWLLGILLVFLMLCFLVTGIVLWYQHRDRAGVMVPSLVLVASFSRAACATSTA